MDATTSHLKNYRVCGEIIISIEVGKRVFTLNCINCTTVCPNLEEFVVHFEERHNKEICFNSEFTEDYGQQIQKYDDEESEILYQKLIANTEAVDANVEELDVQSELCNLLQQPLETEKRKTAKLDKRDPLDGNNDALDKFNTNSDKNEEVEMEYLDEDDTMEDNNELTANIKEEEYISSASDYVFESDEEYIEQETQNNVDDNKLHLAIIKNYKKHAILWNNDHPMSKNRKRREEALSAITESVNKQTHTDLKSNNIADQIKKLRYKYRSELKMIKTAEAKGENYTPQWFYEKMEFLNKTIKYKKRKKRGAKALANGKISLPLSSLTESQNLKLIEIYKSFPCLWNVQHIEFRFKNSRQDAMVSMLNTIKIKMGLELTPDDLRKKLYLIRYACTQDKHRKLHCTKAGKQFKPLCTYYDEISFLEDNVGPFKCNYCDKLFNGPDQYKIHLSEHDGSMPFTCPLCNRGFKKVGNCTVHLRRHTKDYPFECKVCGKRYATTTDVNVHMRNHTGEKPYFCEVCGQSFRTWSFFNAHMRRHQKKRSYKCTICSKAFYENNKLTEHMKAHFNLRDKVCNICNKAFTSAKYLRQHKQIHAEQKKYVCKICSKNFAQYAGLSGHMKSHGTTINGVIIEDS
ncbi:zinc finger protein 583-like [Teleopsis dalmanni]|uniref:zinc finger protein 583-like n=1 Tax=Teleopsis dalmanni TaxID=139649 RepID=UPI000D32AD59|nr:zinc finger protein 583-like [Teleopsis dalmanni]